MRRFFSTMILVVSAAIFYPGCSGGVKEEGPPENAPEMSEEDKKKMEDGIKKQKEMMKKHMRKGPGPR